MDLFLTWILVSVGWTLILVVIPAIAIMLLIRITWFVASLLYYAIPFLVVAGIAYYLGKGTLF